MENGEKKEALIKKSLFKLARQKGGIYYKLGVVLIIGLLLMSLGQFKLLEAADDPAAVVAVAAVNNEAALEAKLTGILGKVKGAGPAMVAVYYEDKGSSDYAYNSTDTENISRDPAGNEEAQRHSQAFTKSLNMVMESNGPVLLNEYSPVIKGVLIVSPGAGNYTVKKELLRAVCGLLGIEAHKVVITEGIGE